jgi:hypothetical protein
MFQEILNKLKKELSYSDREYSKKYNNDILFNEKFNDMNNGCREFTKRLENINSIDVHTYDSNISDKILDEHKNKKIYFYIGCSEFSNFVKQFNKQNNNIQINVNTKDTFVNTISVDKNGVKDNKLIYNLTRIDKGYFELRNSRQEYDINPSSENVFLHFV